MSLINPLAVCAWNASITCAAKVILPTTIKVTRHVLRDWTSAFPDDVAYENEDLYGYSESLFYPPETAFTGISQDHLLVLSDHTRQVIASTLVLPFIIVAAAVLVASILMIVCLENGRSSGKRTSSHGARPLKLVQYWMGNIAPPSIAAEDVGVYLTEHDFFYNRSVLQQALDFDGSTLTDQAKLVHYASDRDDDGKLVLPSRIHPLQTHVQFPLSQHSLQRQLNVVSFGSTDYPSRITTALTTWFAYFSAGLTNLTHSFMVIPVILFCSEATLQEWSIPAPNIYICRNLSKTKPIVPVDKDKVEPLLT